LYLIFSILSLIIILIINFFINCLPLTVILKISYVFKTYFKKLILCTHFIFLIFHLTIILKINYIFFIDLNSIFYENKKMQTHKCCDACVIVSIVRVDLKVI